ncbi:PREDICTED: B3 domain-containing protein REM20-like isoform X2 [Lupinus angustifolius]|uniref:B3 domain-containing protein REM20-like isoform X2 n=1 Tax=Lupinus angustifolius TaxID=3871 RepID=UPI00092E4B3B|nr:PREDICTED: B3 domain-containing protein REM20-like isoform X2 [Lupinus angustifolius]
MDNQVDKYSFITVIKIGINTHQMMIPPDFVKYCDEDFSSTNVILIGPSGDPCRVTILEKDEIFMQDGWPRFLRNNLVEENELLLFTYEGDNCFRVQIFGLNACERLNTKIAPQSSAAKVCSSFFTVFISKFCSERMPIPSDFLKLARLEEREPKEFILRNYSEVGWNVRACSVGSNICFVDGWKQFVADNCLEGEDFIFFKYDGKYKMKFKILKFYDLEQIEVNQEDSVLENQDDEFGGNYHRTGKRKTARSSASKNFGNAKYVHYDNPHFTAILQKGRENELRVPKKLIVDFSLNLPQNITLLCCEHDGRNDVPYLQTLPEETHVRKSRRTVTGELQKWKDGRIFYKGWARFCRVNKIDMKKDECICEFVMGEDEQIQMLQVHVVKNGLLMSAT